MDEMILLVEFLIYFLDSSKMLYLTIDIRESL